ncbi:MAG: hypothetical protein M1829_006206 [Trizodia sp. TS-e1964]|nr:MAG: hypothetical protein M1829_006206 [Trizodia sp. TS-e1964]
MLSRSLAGSLVGALALLAAPAAAFWRLPCKGALVVERADPIVNPGGVSGHVHTIMGGNGFDFTMDYDRARRSTCSSCIVKEDNSNYWVPAVYFKAQNGSFISVEQNGGGLIYYLQRQSPSTEPLLAFPPGFRMLAGNPFLRNYTDTQAQQAISYVCLGTNVPEANTLPNQNCPQGLRVQVFFPSCWDGVNLDSADHKSHMAYPAAYNGGACPSTHPKRFISLFYEVTWNVDAFKNDWYGNEQPFVFANGDQTGYGYHGDFINGWDIPVLQTAIDTCTSASGVVEDCKAFTFRSDSDAQGCKIPASIDEQVFGVMPALPGCNPVQPGPQMAIPHKDCGAPTTIGPKQAFFTDLTTSKGFQYIGCGKDIAFTARTLKGASTSDPAMTVEKCVDFCTGKGFSIAGLEYSVECYCDNSVPDDRKPTPGLPGACEMPCGGNSKEFCGGAQLLSLYQKCGSTCSNIDYSVAGGSSATPSSASTVAPPPSSSSSSSAPATSSSNTGGTQVKVVQTSTTSASSTTSSASAPTTTKASSSSAPAPTDPASSSTDTDGGDVVPSTGTPGTSSDASAPTTFPINSPPPPNSAVDLPAGWKAAGCHTDSIKPRALKYRGWWGQAMTSSGCVKFCDSKGYNFAGTEYSGQCYCDNTLTNSQKTDDSKCNMPCKGDSKQTCGGSGTLSLFTKLPANKRSRRNADTKKRSL